MTALIIALPVFLFLLLISIKEAERRERDERFAAALDAWNLEVLQRQIRQIYTAR